jgi:hypothetical protein
MHDKFGYPISVGNYVVIRGKVIGANSSGDGTFCSVNVEIDGDWDGKGNVGSNWFSAKQVEVLNKVEVSP